MHLIKATVIKAILAGTATTAAVSTGVVLTTAAVKFSTGDRAETAKEIEIEGENQSFDRETSDSPMIASQEDNDEANSDLTDTTDNTPESDVTEAAHENTAAVNNIGIGSPDKTAPDKTADNNSAVVTGNTGNDSAAAGSTINTAVNASDKSVSTAAPTDNDSVSADTDTGNSAVITAASANNSAPSTVDTGSSPVYTAARTDTGNDAVSSGAASLPEYHHSTSIYDDDGALLRVEYYVEDQNLPAEYSDVTDFDKDTNSYTETVYRYDEENDTEVVVRTDTYVGGELVSSEVP